MATALRDLPPHVQALIAAQDETSRARPGPLAGATTHDPLAKLNKTERLYAAGLETRKRTGAIRDYTIQAMTFVLGPDLRFTPDFVVIESDGTLTAVDTKGTFVREDAIIKLKVAAATFPWIRWKMIENRRGTFTTVRALNDVPVKGAA